jgi:hypothetical protein
VVDPAVRGRAQSGVPTFEVAQRRQTIAIKAVLIWIRGRRTIKTALTRRLVNVLRDNDKEVSTFVASSCDQKIVVSVDINGASSRVQLSSGALETSDEELASRIIRLNTLACLRWQLAQSREVSSSSDDGPRRSVPSEAQVAAYAEMIDF